ncbi:MAG: DUF433 domain-containing protein [Phycisphaeraceae bacterium]
MTQLSIEPQLIPLKEWPGGVIRVGTSRVSLDSVIFHFDNGASAEEIVSAFPTLELPDVYAVIAYYLRNPEPIKAYIRQRESEAKELEEKLNPPEKRNALRDKLMARARQKGLL